MIFKNTIRNFITGVFLLLSINCISQISDTDDHLTIREFGEKYAHALTIRFCWPPDHPKYISHSFAQLYHDGTESSPYLKYLDEMKFWGFKGIRINFPRAEDLDFFFDEDLEKYRIPEEVFTKMKERVQLALDRGYYVMVLGPSLSYGKLQNEENPEDRLTDNHVQKHYDMWEQFVEEFKDFPDSVAYQPTSETHQWDYEQHVLDESDPNFLTDEEFEEKFVAHCQEFGSILNQIDPHRNIYYNTPWGNWHERLNFPFPGDPPVDSDDVHYGSNRSNYGPNTKRWEWWGLDHETYDEEYLLNILWPSQVSEPTDYISGNQVGYRINNWASPHYQAPPVSDNPDNKGHVDFKQITDWQCIQMSEHVIQTFKEHDAVYEYADIRCETDIWDPVNFNVKVPGSYHNDKLFKLFLDYEGLAHLNIHSTAGGTVSHQLGEDHNGKYLIKQGEEISLLAIPDPGYEFVKWTGTFTGNESEINFTPNENYVILIPNFRLIDAANYIIETPTELSRQWSINEVIDYTYVEEINPDSNFHNKEHMLVKGAFDNDTDVKYAVLKFEVTNMPDTGNIDYATIAFRTHRNETNRRAFLEAFEITNDWTASQLTWNNLPAHDTLPVSNEFEFDSRSRSPVDLDITDLVNEKRNGVYSFIIKSHFKAPFGTYTGEGLRVYSSREAGNYQTYSKPMLYVAWGEDQINTSSEILTSTEGEVINESNEVEIFPNPANNYIDVKMSETYDNGIFIMYDISGRKVLEQNIRNNNKISIEHLQSGEYLFVVTKEKNTHKGKLVKH